MTSRPVDAKLYRAVMGRFATGVCVVTTQVGDEVHGATINSFTSVSLEPPLVLVSIDKRARLHRYLELAGRYAVSVLSLAQEAQSNHFAGRRQEGVQFDFDVRDGLPVLVGSLAYITARVVAAHPAGDHTLFVGHVESLEPHDGEPLLFFRGRYGRIDPAWQDTPIGPYSVIAMRQFLDDDEVVI